MLLKQRSWLVASVLVVSISVGAALWSNAPAADKISVIVNGNRFSQQGFLHDGVLMLPLIPTFEALGAVVEQLDNGRIFIRSQTIHISLQLDTPYAFVSQRIAESDHGGHWQFIWSYDENGHQDDPYKGYHTEVPPLLYDNQPMIPASFLGHILAAELATSGNQRQIHLNVAPMPRPEVPMASEPVINESAAHPEIVALVKEIIQGHNTDYTRVRAIYDWLTHNIEYDRDFREQRRNTPHIFRGDDFRKMQEPIETLHRRIALCGEYAELAQAMFDVLGLPNRCIDGFNRYPREEWNTNPSVSHGWNEVLIDGKWIFMDATRGAGYPVARVWFDSGDIAYMVSHGRFLAMPPTPERLKQFYFNLPLDERLEAGFALKQYLQELDWPIDNRLLIHVVGYKNDTGMVFYAHTRLEGIEGMQAEEQLYWRHVMKLDDEGQWVVLGGERLGQEPIFWRYDAPYNMSVRE